MPVFGKVYKLVCNHCQKEYVGSTMLESIEYRFASHKFTCIYQKKKNYRLYRHMREIGMDKFSIEKLDECSVDCRYQLRCMENSWMLKLNSVGNGLNQYYAIKIPRKYKPKIHICELCNYRSGRVDSLKEHKKSKKHQRNVQIHLENGQPNLS